jgi:RIO kinase 1
MGTSMKVPEALQELLHDGIIDGVYRQLKSGKEASVYVVSASGEYRCAKVYKDMQKRSFKQRAQYQEGRNARSSRDRRAMGKSSSFGKRAAEEQWKNAEVDALFQLHKAGLRVPEPHGFYSGVLIMEMVLDPWGESAPRLNEVELTPEHAREYHFILMDQIKLMLCEGLIHGDLSEYNVLIDATGPVIIDLPQVVSAAGNNNAFAMLKRDVGNITNTLAAIAPELAKTHYAEEMWALFQKTELRPDTLLTGRFKFNHKRANVREVMDAIVDAKEVALIRQQGREAAERDGA